MQRRMFNKIKLIEIYWLPTKVPILSGWGVNLSKRLHLVPWLRMSGTILLLPLHAFMVLTRKSFTSIFYQLYMTVKYSPFLYGNENANCGHDMSLSEQLL